MGIRKEQYGVVLVLLALMLGGCDPARQSAEKEAVIHVSALTLTPRTLSISEDLPGRVAAFRTAEIRPQVSGIVQQRLFEQGADVKAGEALFQIDAVPFKADVETAAAAVKRAKAVLARAVLQTERLEPLVRADAVSQQLYDDAASQRDQAAADVMQTKAVLARRQLDLKFATVTAAIGGRIDQAVASEGALVATADNQPMATIQQIDKVYVDVPQSASAMGRWRDVEQLEMRAGGVAVQILDSSGSAVADSGRVLFSGISVDATTGSVLLRIQVDNPDQQLLPGMFVLARVPRARYADALSVPQHAVLHRDGYASVWVVDEHEQVHRIPVELGERVDRHYRIIAGLNAGERVVIEGIERLTEGASVTARLWQSDTAGASAGSSVR